MKIEFEIPEKKFSRIIKRELKKKDPDYFGIKVLCLDRALDCFNKNQEHFAYLHAAILFELLNYTKSGVLKEVEILAKKEEACEICHSQNGQRFSLMDAIEKMPIPHKECTTWKDDHLGKHKHGWCRCTWLPIVEDN